jgi:hypothetical protein
MRGAFLRSVLQLLVSANGIPSSLILDTLMKELIHSSKTLVLTRVTRRNIAEDGILHSQKQNKQTPWPLVRERTIPTERPPLVDEI